MPVRVGLVGCGQMGAEHARILLSGSVGGRLSAVYDADPERAAVVAGAAGATVRATPEQLVADRDVDAVLVAAPDEFHAPLVMACLDANKPVLCEKPLAATPEACLKIVEAEAALDRRLVQVGFMRRFDPGYRAMRETRRNNDLGAPIFLHHAHRNAVAPPYITSDQVLGNSSVHEFDVSRFVLGEEITAVTVTSARASRRAPHRRPQFATLETGSGVVVTVEAFSDAHYGYDVRGELVCEDGAVALAPEQPVLFRTEQRVGWTLERDWIGRFNRAYEQQLREWLFAVRDGGSCGASAWDGFAASHIAAAALDALRCRARVAIEWPTRPALYEPG